MLISSGNKEILQGVHPMGIGLIETSINLSRVCLFNKPDFLLFFGSAGSYGEHKVFDIIESSSSSNVELSFLQDNSYTPIDNACDNEVSFCKN
jgi:nucleoside phosphorylase